MARAGAYPIGYIFMCGPRCPHDHNSLNGPTGCCPEHGPYMYFCSEEHK